MFNAQGVLDLPILRDKPRGPRRLLFREGKVAAEGILSGTCRRVLFFYLFMTIDFNWLMSDLTCMQCADKSPLQPPNLFPFPPISIQSTCPCYSWDSTS